MASEILPVHPLSALPVDEDNLRFIFDHEDRFIIPLERLEELIREMPSGELRGYLWGLYDQRRMELYCTPG